MSRSVVRVVAITAIAVSSGAVVAVPPAMADIGADMRFVCDGATGTREVGLRIQAGAPTSGNVGEPLQLGTIKVDVGIPAALADEVAAKSPGEASAPPVTGVAPAPSPAIAGVAQIQVAVDGPGREQQGSGWPAFALAATPSREDGTVHLTGSGVAPPLVPRSSGGLSWVAGDLELNLVPSDAATGTEKAGVSLRCAAEKQTVMGAVRVRGGSQAAPNGRSGVSPQAAAPSEKACKEIPPPGVDPRYDFNPDPDLMKIYDDPKRPDDATQSPEDGGIPMCISAAGFFNVKKAGNAVPVSAKSLLRRQVKTYAGDPWFGSNYLEDQGYFVNSTEPVPATVLGFGFMPTRAIAEAVQVRSPRGGKNDPIAGNYRFLTFTPGNAPNVLKDTGIQVAAYIRVKADKAAVNGVPIDLGNKCMTTPTRLSAASFMGNEKTGVLNPIPGQSLISENLEIPAFSGCGATEDLSPLLTASVSGSGNYVNVHSGVWCMVTDGSGCVNGEGAQPTTLTVSPGGNVTAVAKPFTIVSNWEGGGQLSCESATIRFHLDQGHWQAPFMLAKSRMSFEGCTVKGPDGTIYPSAGEVTQENDLFLNVLQVEDDGKVQIAMENVVINAPLIVNGEECSLRLARGQFSGFDYIEGPGRFTGSYDNGVMSLSLAPGELMSSPASTCFGVGFDVALEAKGEFGLHPPQSITSP
ncbi:hypothetical protein [Actinomadura monticuli]|uniref:Secreted protein n=1 Tax=Actinomadura monticuli TaxID=3097367 RepID=A0ABV4QC12_9ACTN